MSLKDLTYEQHRNAETQPFVKILFSGNIAPKLYATYLYNQHAMYNLLEAHAMAKGLLNAYPSVRRAPHIYNDFLELWEDKDNPPPLVPTTKKYIDYLESIQEDSKKILANLYVRHFGDLSGGQMIKKRVPGKGTYYVFEGDVEQIKTELRKQLDDSMADEAKIAFEFATEFFKDMLDVANAQQ